MTQVEKTSATSLIIKIKNNNPHYVHVNINIVFNVVGIAVQGLPKCHFTDILYFTFFIFTKSTQHGPLTYSCEEKT